MSLRLLEGDGVQGEDFGLRGDFMQGVGHPIPMPLLIGQKLLTPFDEVLAPGIELGVRFHGKTVVEDSHFDTFAFR